MTLVASPVGPLRLSTNGTHLTGVHFAPTEIPDASGPPRGVLAETAAQLAAYFRGELREFDLPLAAAGTAFQQRVWTALRQIPYGEVRSYRDIATTIGSPAAVRAVGLANGRNPISIVVPCHRVIGADGSLTGYGGGLPVKSALLTLEGAPVRGLEPTLL